MRHVIRPIIASIGCKIQTLNHTLLTPTDAALLATFRVLFGAIMVWEVYRYYHYNRIANYYITPKFYFTYELFPFVTPLPGPWLYLVFFVMGLSALGIAVGLFYRASAVIFFFSYTYIFLLDKTQYNNHYYLIILLAFLFIWVDAHRWASIDQKLRPALRAEVVPFWQIFIFRAQIIIVYFYGGLAKINIDWLVGEPMRLWLQKRADSTAIGPVLEHEAAVYFFSYGGLLFDLFIGFLLLWKPTRPLAVVLIIFFHLTNAWLFSIGIFPYLMIAATILFANPDWPRRVLRRARPDMSNVSPRHMVSYHHWALGVVALYLLLQILIPLRHWLYPNYVAWSEEGHRFAWRMKLRDKSGSLAFYVTDPDTNQAWGVELEQDLTERQMNKMITRPDMILQYAHHLKIRAQQAGITSPVIKVQSWASLNGRAYQQMIDPAANLADTPQTIFAPAPWILPFQTNPVSPFADSSN